MGIDSIVKQKTRFHRTVVLGKCAHCLNSAHKARCFGCEVSFNSTAVVLQTQGFVVVLYSTHFFFKTLPQWSLSDLAWSWRTECIIKVAVEWNMHLQSSEDLLQEGENFAFDACIVLLFHISFYILFPSGLSLLDCVMFLSFGSWKTQNINCHWLPSLFQTNDKTLKAEPR